MHINLSNRRRFILSVKLDSMRWFSHRRRTGGRHFVLFLFLMTLIFDLYARIRTRARFLYSAPSRQGLRKILRVSWTAKKTNEWVLNKAGVKRELLDTVKARKLAYYGHTMMKQGNCLEKEIMQGTMPGARRRGRPRTAWIGNIKSWTGLSVEESVRMTEDRDKWRKYVHGVANPRIEEG